MRRLFLASQILLGLLLLEALSTPAWAQTGKLSGTVTDAATGDALPGVTVVLEGTNQGAAADASGNYFIIGIRPGTYDVRASFVGYETKVTENVLITSDRTTTLNITLREDVIEGAEIVVEAERPVVDPNQTTSRALVTNDEIARLPVATLDEVIAKTSNSWNGYIRGSRRFETKTILEGIDISDAFYQTTPSGNGNYGGNTYHNTNKADRTSPSLFEINPEAVGEVAVNSGATEARYTSGTGGVVTVSMAEARGPIRGSISARVAPQINRPGPDSLDFYQENIGGVTMAQAYDQDRATLQQLANAGDAIAAERVKWYTWDPEKYAASDDPEMDFRASVGGSITDKWHFSAYGRWFESNGFMPNQYDKRLSGQLKTTYELSSKTSISAVGILEDRGLWGNWNNTDYRDVFRFYLEGVAQNDGGSYLGSLKLTQVINDQSFVTAQVYRTYWRDRYGYPDDDGDGFTEVGENGDFIDFSDPAVIAQYIGVNGDHTKMFEDRISDPFSDANLFLPNGLRYRTRAPVVYGEDTITELNGVKVDYANQLTFNHFLQFGAEFKARNIAYEEFYGVDGIGFTLNAEEEPYIPSDWERSPWELAFYGSDRMEYAGLIINLGLRVELVDRDMQEIVDHYYPFERTTEMIAGRELLRNSFVRGDDVPIDVMFNPSIGISHPIGSTGAMYFSYKRAQQLPTYSRLYQKYGGNNSNSRFFQYTDPNMDLITSDNYELGVQWEFSEGWGVDANAYARAVDNFGIRFFNANKDVPANVETDDIGSSHPLFSYLTDFGYADSRGIELVLRRAPLSLAEDFTLGLTASYTFATVEAAQAAGVNQTTFNREEGETQLPFDNAEDFRHFPINVRGGASIIQSGYDRRHRGVLRASAGLPLDISAGLSATVESGFLYSPAIVEDERDRELLTGPTNYQIDLRLEKRFNFGNRLGLDAFFDITNLTDKRNVIAYDNNPNSPGPIIFQETGVPGQRLVNVDGTVVYGPARNFYFGTRLRF